MEKDECEVKYRGIGIYFPILLDKIVVNIYIFNKK